MSDTGIDNLVIKINTEADGASKGIESLIGTLEKLETVTAKLTTSNSTLKQLGDSFKYIKRTSKELTLGNTTKTLSGLTNSLNKMESSTNGLGKSLRTSSKLFNLGGMVRIGKTIASVFSTSIKAANDYVESQNLFLVAMGEYADEATEWSNRVSEALGIDPAEMQKNMGYFQQLATALGVASDQAYVLTKNMTSLAYDISSLYNIGIDQSFLKLQSAIVGELEPIRRLGIDISKARLQQELYDLGIRQNVETLSQADKAILRYIAIMKQTKNAQADMGKTLMSPANALRVLKSSFIQLSRAVGYVFIPILQALLPVVQLVTKALAILAEKLAIFLGYEAPKFDTTGLGDASDDFNALGGEIDDTAAKIKSFTTGFDELNVISNDTSGLGGAAGSILGGIELPEYDLLSKYAGNITNEVLPKLMEAFEEFGNSAGVQLALGILKDLWDTLKGFAEWALENPEAFGNWLTGIAGALLIIAGIKGLAGIGNGLVFIGTGLLNLYNIYKKIKSFDILTDLAEVLGYAGLLAGALIAIIAAFKLATGRTEDFAATAKTALLGVGIMVLSLGVMMMSGPIAAIGLAVIAFSAFAEETLFVLAWWAKKIIDGVSWLVTSVVTMFLNIGEGFRWVIDDIITILSTTISSIINSVKLMVFKIIKFVKEKIGEFLDSGFMQNFIGFLDNLLGTDMSSSIELHLDTSDLDKEITELENGVLMGVNWWDTLTGEIDKNYQEHKKNEAAIYSGGHAVFDTIEEWTSKMEDAAALKMVSKWNDQKNEEGILAKLGVNYDFQIGTEKLLEEVQEEAEVMASQLDIQGLQLNEAELANELSQADAVVTSKTLEATNETNTKLSNLWWKLDDVQKACENIKIEVYNVYGSGEVAGEYAAGGLPSKGDLFIANEAGPEFVGSIGSQTAVANSDQMVAAFAQGVYQGMMAARRDSGSQKIQVPVSVLLPNGRALATATAEGQIDNGYDMGLGGFDV